MGYREQYDRMMRWHSHWMQWEVGQRSPDPAEPQPGDVVNAFFLACHHLWDWIAEDDALPRKPRRLARCYAREGPLLLCAHIANASKHVTLSLRPGAIPPKLVTRTDATVTVPAFVFSEDDFFAALPPTQGIVFHTTRFSVDLGYGKTMDALDLADQCIGAWRTFLAKHGLPF
jgi:hypothetical protein